MKKIYILFIMLVFSGLNAQIKFESGYFIKSDGERVECLIKNSEWKDNPSEFEYRMAENAEIQKGDLKTVKEFGVYDVSKYLRAEVDLDRSSDNVADLNTDRNPKFERETLFLNVLIEGDASLYSYVSGNLFRFFYSKSDVEIKPLNYKRYLAINDKGEQRIAKNELYKSQLRTDLQCNSALSDKIRNLDYKSNILIGFFKEFNNCRNSEIVEFAGKGKTVFHLSIRPRMNRTSMRYVNRTDKSLDIPFENKTDFSAGIEVEMLLPFNKGKWAIYAEPSFISYKTDKTVEYKKVSGGILDVHTQYSALELGVGGRHYMYLSPESKLFLGFTYLMDFGVGENYLERRRNDGSLFERIDITGVNYRFGFSAGYKLMDKFSIELRAETKEKVYFSTYKDINYNNFSVILGYSFF